VVNFCVTEFALEEQCLGLVVQQEAPMIESTKNDNVKKIADKNAELQKFEDDILMSLSVDKGIPLLEDIELIDTLNKAKEGAEEAKTAQETLKIAMKKILENRENYRPVGKKAAALYFVLFDLPIVDPMYQFSLGWYKNLFLRSIADSRESANPDRFKSIVTTHTLNVYKQACKTLFERHKLLLSLQMCIKLMAAEGEIDN
jgi:dynein heavy chain